MVRALVAVGSVLGFLGVAAGAFGAHALRERLRPEDGTVWKTAADYQMLHGLAAVAAALAAGRWSSGIAAAAGWCFVAGALLFSGSLYAMTLTGRRGIGAITPVGGIGFLAGWVLLALAAL